MGRGFAKYANMSTTSWPRGQHQNTPATVSNLTTALYRQNEDSLSDSDEESSRGSCRSSRAEDSDPEDDDVEGCRANDENDDGSASSLRSNEDRPLSPWGDKCRSKQKIVEELKREASDIHFFIPDDPTDFNNVAFQEIHKRYAPRYQLSRFKGYMKSILKNFKDGTRQFKDDSNGIEPWTSRSKRSEGWHLLYGLLVDNESRDRLEAMSLQDIWESNRLFKCYPLNDFKKYYKDMDKLTKKRRQKLDEDELVFQQYCRDFPAKELTSKGEPFWYNHPAKSLLAEDVKSGLASDMKPADLWLTRDEYQEFTLKTFRAHIYQEKEKQRARPYWRKRRDEQAKIELDKEREKMKQEWMDDRFRLDFSELHM